MDQERQALDQNAAIVDLSFNGAIVIAGPQRADFLSGLITNQIKRVNAQTAIYAALLSAQGRFQWDFTILQIDAEAEGEDPRLLMLLEPGAHTALFQRLSMYLLRTQATLTDHSEQLGALGVAGPNALEVLQKTWPDATFSAELGATVSPQAGVWVIADPRHSLWGYRVIADAAALPGLWDQLTAHAAPAGFAAWESYRIANALPRGGGDLVPDLSIPLESGFLEMNGVDFNKGCYIGQETTARTYHRGTLKKRLFRLTLEGKPNLGDSVMSGTDHEVGMVTSVDPNGGQALAVLRASDVADGKPLRVGNTEVKAVSKPTWATWE
ncbi:putative glycine cleavage T protein [Magnetofaba australis IT-1]|uniref:Putative glycine cleavage T protein n=1 Tax=Magnetofaba australis IT-1 TaxID=1434232 RepID=A0A1Y2K0V6_9PROT|nr:putative glycine cleavage T protein [Magnetofaba australis IT-1]